ncbi:hypothetical protein RSOLAG1IB_08927 [Rhizoctonia solani AG-1 IB]|uniref:Uncharacterized protein n=1 Tax=Thanatephorus cucumeris (strain AG1-IB / isolate 7/3/14) TaxID=1108050 RepID=A0A0B7FRU6_THACB|nr:hypothetical protein RSOLAG1IB_08927 [Rhizoctonia solani AG-1 IB]
MIGSNSPDFRICLLLLTQKPSPKRKAVTRSLMGEPRDPYFGSSTKQLVPSDEPPRPASTARDGAKASKCRPDHLDTISVPHHLCLAVFEVAISSESTRQFEHVQSSSTGGTTLICHNLDPAGRFYVRLDDRASDYISSGY